jgi:SAM-dependent methyltransferase
MATWRAVLGFRVVEGGFVTQALDALLSELEQFGKANDGVNAERPRRMLNITRDTGEFLAVLVRATVARRVLEIGTSNGYSTLWLASAARAVGGAVTTVELSDYKIGLATANFVRSGLARHITLVHDDAGRVLRRSADGAFDFVFLARSTRAGGRISGACCGQAGSWSWTTRPRTRPRWRRSSRWSRPTPRSPRAWFPRAMGSFSP